MPKVKEGVKASQKACILTSDPILCHGPGCKLLFLPKRRNQNFCSPGCREEFFAIARKIGTLLLDRGRVDPKMSALVQDLLNGV